MIRYTVRSRNHKNTGLVYGTTAFRLDAAGMLCSQGDDLDGRFVCEKPGGAILATENGAEWFRKVPSSFELTPEPPVAAAPEPIKQPVAQIHAVPETGDDSASDVDPVIPMRRQRGRPPKSAQR